MAYIPPNGTPRVLLGYDYDSEMHGVPSDW